ncbi:sulfatase-like hydrolase/transferase [Lacipirellula limnantheis]|uniref:Arylsulfatase n=1 Tax=Lacipirellula limnantheis TaxID=2528024 RepID=A0A517TUC0_9BACT|nr:sulfatase-like hydrolase/transferase [Lacipirellula limnantheis]QDT71966.1 Arylsulfatase [Lacipirellula limnantheis]
MRTPSDIGYSWGVLLRRCRLFSALLSFSLVAANAFAAAPNIVLFIVDDMGWNGTSALMDPTIPGSKSDFYQTPNIAALAASGMRFSNGYAASPYCASTRASLMTGKSPAQVQMTDIKDAQPGSVRYTGGYTNLPLTPPTPEFFDPTQLTIPRLLKQTNSQYQTALFGKWHLNLPSSITPLASGFDVASDPPLPPNEVDPWGVQQISNLANDFMQTNVANDKPFFVEVAYKAPHEPIRSRQEVRDKYAALPPGTVHKSVPYAAMVDDLDSAVGTVLNKINDLGIADNTYIFFVTDNGAPIAYSSNAPLREGKVTIFEGGIRSPYIVKGPGVQANSFSSVPVLTTDLMTTFAALAGFEGPTPQGVEGADLTPVMFNGGALPEGMDYLERQYAQHGEIYFHNPHNPALGATWRVQPASSVRDGDYKLIRQYGENGNPDTYLLYNLKTNISENINLANSMPQKVAEMKLLLDNYLESVDASFAYDVKAPTQLSWKGSQPGAAATAWRSTIDVKYKARETWNLGTATETPALVNVSAFQSGLSNKAFSFDGNDGMKGRFFHVGDTGPRQNTINVGTPDFDRSVAADVWFRADNLSHNQILLESGDATTGLSLTLGDADANGSFNDLRFRVRGASGDALTVTVPINNFANPQTDFINATAVFSDNDNARYIELYINGALAGRVDGTLGSAASLLWDGYDDAGLGKTGGSGLGANGGTGALPFNGAFTGKMAEVSYWNYALTPAQIAGNYNAKLDAVSFGVKAMTGSTITPLARPTNVALGAAESNSLQVIQERQHRLANALSVDGVIVGGQTANSGASFNPGNLAAGTDFTSYLLHFDAIGAAAGNSTITGSVTFAYDIIGVVTAAAKLAASDPILGSIGQYGAAADRGLLLAGTDFITISANRRTLSYSLTVANNDVAEFRILTSPALPADFNGDGLVNASDLTIWSSAMGKTGAGDANGDGATDGADYLVWQRSIGASAGGTFAAGAVPEPATAAMLSIGAIGLLGVARRRVA